MPATNKEIRLRRIGQSYEEIQRDLLARIELGAWPAGAKIPVRHQLAKEYKVAVATLERAVSGLVRQGVLTTNRTGTFVASAQSTKTHDVQKHRPLEPSSGSARVNALLDAPRRSVGDRLDERVRVGSSTHSHSELRLERGPLHLEVSHRNDLRGAEKPFTWIITNLSEKLSERIPDHWVHRAATSFERSIQLAGGRTLLVDLGIGRTMHPFSNLDDAISHGINSVVLLSGIEDNPEHLPLVEQLMAARAAGRQDVVAAEIAMSHCAWWSFDSVGYDGSQGVYAAIKHLISLGHRNIAFLGQADVEWVRRRLYAFQVAMTGAGLDARCVVPAPFTEADIVSGKIRWLDVADAVAADFLKSPESREVTAAFVINDHIGIRVAKACRIAGRPVPEELSLVGFDDIPEAASNGLTTIHPPIEEMGALAADLIVQRLNQPEPARQANIVLNPSLVVRSTTRAIQPALDDLQQ